MTALFELFYFLAVTAPAVVRRDNHGDALAVVLECCWIFLTGTMARIAVHILLGVALSRHCSTMPGVLVLWQSRHA